MKQLVETSTNACFYLIYQKKKKRTNSVYVGANYIRSHHIYTYNSDSQSLFKLTFLLGDPGCSKEGLVGFPKTTFRKALKNKTRVAKGMNLVVSRNLRNSLAKTAAVCST